jgi:hypothetical protein
MLRRSLALLPFVLIATGCGENNQEEIASLKAQVEQSRKETSELKVSMGTEVASLKERLDRLETPRAKAEPARTSPAPSGDVATITKTITECVRNVRSLETQPKGFGGQPYAEFDAFYNPGNGRVENNNRYVDQGPNYAFNKCMASKGVPLTYN